MNARVNILLAASMLMLPQRAQAHPLHLSVTNITYENGMLKVSVKTFRDDWQTAYFHYHGRSVEVTPDLFGHGTWFRTYLEENFFLAPEESSRRFDLVVDTVTLPGDVFSLEVNAMTIEMHARVPREPNSLYIYNAILTDIFPDQSNLVIYGVQQRERGIKFDIRKQDAEVKLN